MCFVPLFAALNPVSLLPLFAALTRGVPPGMVRRILAQSLATATIVALLFLVGGKALFVALGISVADFMVAGGVVLFVISLRNLQSDDPPRRAAAESLGAVPLGVPLIVGPATLTTLLLLHDQYGPVATVAALVVNLWLVAWILGTATRLERWLGRAGSRAVAKVSELVLAAIAVNIARRGIEQLWGAASGR
jgi:multiple antibiotic resistance protein